MSHLHPSTQETPLHVHWNPQKVNPCKISEQAKQALRMSVMQVSPRNHGEDKNFFELLYIYFLILIF